ncbi:MAG: sugar phosphate isomerase/epimerase [Bacteroidales bacterium]
MRKFLCLVIAAVLILSVVIQAQTGTGTKKHLGIATYSVKGLESDIEGAFRALADDGYVVMEISNYNAGSGTVAGYKPAEYAALAEKYGIDIISSHARAKFDVKDVEGTLTAWGKVLDDHKAMGCKYVVFPMYTWAGTVEGVKAECDLMNKIGTEANKRGIKFGYHNHNFEFATLANTNQLYEDFLIANTDPDKVFFQMDVYWITVGGQDPVAYLKKYPSRFKVLHIKDEYVVGESGKLNYEAIFNQFYKNGYEDWFVEMEGKMTKEQLEQNLARMEQMKQRQAQGGQQAGPQGGAPGQGRPAGQQQGAQAGAPGQGRPAGQGAPPAGMGQRDPKMQAEQLKTSLEGIKQSADYLLKSTFVK